MWWKGKLKRSWLELINAKRRIRRSDVALILGLGLVLSVGLASRPGGGGRRHPDARTTPDLSAAIGVDLPHTDGFGLLPGRRLSPN
ncbi:MAG: hypothetical protein IPK83_24765 [Planctomycetes bacterium]|nr:hypothetical protein [Planctomycetota bacterium]